MMQIEILYATSSCNSFHRSFSINIPGIVDFLHNLLKCFGDGVMPRLTNRMLTTAQFLADLRRSHGRKFGSVFLSYWPSSSCTAKTYENTLSELKWVISWRSIPNGSCAFTTDDQSIIKSLEPP